MFGKKKKRIAELEAQLQEANSRLSALEQEKSGLTAVVTEYRNREVAISRAMTDAAVAADSMLKRAEADSEQMKAQAAEDAKLAVAQGETACREAEEKAERIVQEAEEKSAKRLQDTEEEIRSYAEVLCKLNENMKEQARLAQEASEKYASFYATLSDAMPGLLSTLPLPELSEAAEKPVADTGDASLNEDTASDAPAEESVPAPKAEPDSASPGVVRVSDLFASEEAAEQVTTEELLSSLPEEGKES